MIRKPATPECQQRTLSLVRSSRFSVFSLAPCANDAITTLHNGPTPTLPLLYAGEGGGEGLRLEDFNTHPQAEEDPHPNPLPSTGERTRRRLAILLALVLTLLSLPTSAQISFRDTTEESALKKPLDGAFNHAIAWGDFDNDGRLDLFVGNFTDHAILPKYNQTEPTRHGLFRQTAPGKFAAVPMPSIERNGRCSGALWVDLDNDGDLDLVITNNTHPPADPNAAPPRRRPAADSLPKPGRNEPSALFRNDGNNFVDISKESGAIPADLYFARDVIALDYDGDGLLDLLFCEDKIFQKVAHCRLMHNLGNLKFEDATAKAGLPTDLDALSATIADLNNDGRPDLYFTSCNRLFFSQPNGAYREGEVLRQMFAYKSIDAEDYTCGAVFADIDNDGDMDLLTGTHFMPSRIRVFINDGMKDGVPQFHDATKELNLPALPNKAPTPDVADFDNDGLPDLYWSAWFIEGEKADIRRPFICRGLGQRDGKPAFDIPSIEGLLLNRKNLSAPGQKGMVYYVNGPAVDYDTDGKLDFLAGIWPDENSRLFHNETANNNHWLEIRVNGDGKTFNKMGIGAKIKVAANGKLLGYREITTPGGYSGSRPAIAHVGLGTQAQIDLEIQIPGRKEPILLHHPQVDRLITIDAK